MALDKTSLEAFKVAFNDWDDNNRSMEYYEEYSEKLEEIYEVLGKLVDGTTHSCHEEQCQYDPKDYSELHCSFCKKLVWTYDNGVITNHEEFFFNSCDGKEAEVPHCEDCCFEFDRHFDANGDLTE